ncbi:MAG: PAS domain-containing sensor histidine kinase [bacterium]
MKEKNDLLEKIFNNNIDLVALADLEGNFTLVGKSHEILGYDIEYLIGKNVMDFVHPEDVSFVSNEFNKFLLSPENQSTVEYRYKRIDGEYLWFETIGTLLKDKNGNPEQILFNTRDITKRKQSEDLLKKHITTIHKIYEYSIELGFLQYDELFPHIVKTLMDIFNPKVAWVNVYDEETSTMITKSTSLTDEENSWVKKKIGKKINDLRVHISEEQYMVMKNEKVGSLSSLSELSFGAIPEIVGKSIEKAFGIEWFMPVAFVNKDKLAGTAVIAGSSGHEALDREEILIFAGITANALVRKQAEEEIKRQLEEKETLLREVHHRIKNNVNSIESLLSMQARSADNSEVILALQESISRVQSIRVLYDKLLIDKDYRDVSIRSYMESLIDSLVAVFPESKNVTIEKKITDFTLNSRKVIPVGIIVNELLTNIFKYAFKGRDEGRILVKLDKKENHVTLTIQDDGVGIDEGIDANKSPGFGLTIVRMLAQQLKGTYTVENDKGTRSILEFEI